VTGAETLYAEMGHFGAEPIRLAWLASRRRRGLLAFARFERQPLKALVEISELSLGSRCSSHRH
jgi:hypothetical protein